MGLSSQASLRQRIKGLRSQEESQKIWNYYTCTMSRIIKADIEKIQCGTF